MKIINDIHLGVQRRAGTTPTSQEALRAYTFKKFGALLDDDEILIAGDLFDTFEVPARDLLETFRVISSHLIARPKARITMIPGNHDDSPKALRVSSFKLLGEILSSAFPGRALAIDIDQGIYEHGVFSLSHCSNQDIFNQKLEASATQLGNTVKYLVLHCNYDNGFAVDSDHSLNLSSEQAQKIVDKGIKILVAHEHQAKTALDGHLIVMGNQFPTSIADCLGNLHKCAHIVGDQVTKEVVWNRDDVDGCYDEYPWDALDGAVSTSKFLRVGGKATAAQAGQVVQEIAKFRNRSDAFIVSNAVKIDGIVAPEELPESFEVAKRFDVMEFVYKTLDDAERAAVESLIHQE